MFGLSILNNIVGSASASKQEVKLEEGRRREAENDRAEAERGLDARKREFGSEAGNPATGKENDPRAKV